MSNYKKPALVVMAAGMGSRYGGLKQIDPIGSHGEILIDYTLYDAKKAGFEDIVFIVSRRIEQDFKSVIGKRIEGRFKSVRYVFQELSSMLPAHIKMPEDRKKPWGTGHAVLCCKELIDGPFAVVNADDYYGKRAFSLLYGQLSSMNEPYSWCMVGYELLKTLTEHGHVARGICEVDENGMLKSITERVRIEKRDNGAQYTEDEGQTYVPLPVNATASMNLWGFKPDIFSALEERFPEFIDRALKDNPTGAEFFLPSVVGEYISCHKAVVKVLPSPDRWYGVTYREDKPVVIAAIEGMVRAGDYPERIW